MTISNMRRCSFNARQSHRCCRNGNSSIFNGSGVHRIAIALLLQLVPTIMIQLLKINFTVVVKAMPMMINIEPYDDECFFIKLPSASKEKPKAKILTGSYEMVDEKNHEGRVSPEPLLAYILETAVRNDANNHNPDPNNNDKIIWRSIPNEARGNFRIPITTAKRGYWLCFQNSSHGPDNPNQEGDHPDHTVRTIGFDYQVNSIIPDVKPAPLLFTSDHSDEWRDKSSLVQAEIRQLMTHRDFMHLRESDHRTLVENTFDDIMSWTLIQTTLVVIIAICQVFYFRRFLEKKPRY